MYKRQVLVDQSPISMKQINDNFSALFLKVSGNIDTIDLRDGAIKTDKIADNAVTGDKILDGSLTIINLESDFVKGLNLLDNPVFTSLATNVEGNGTLIQQNTEKITLQASGISTNADGIASLNSDLAVESNRITAVVTSVSNNTADIGVLEVSSSNISASVKTIERDIGSLESDLEVQAGQIRSRVTYTDYNGNEIASLINQKATNVTIDAEKIDLRGVTTIYDRYDDRYYVQMDRGDIYSKGEYGELFSTSSTSMNTTMRLRGSDILSYGLTADMIIHPPIDFSSGVTFSGDGPVMPRRASDKIEIDVVSSGLDIYRDGTKQGRVAFV